MNRRMPQFAGMFYPSGREACAAGVDESAASAEPDSAPPAGAPVGAIVPHAGWSYSGPTAACAFKLLAAAPRFDAFLVFGAVHTYGVEIASAYPDGAWSTPLGDIAVDAELAAAIVREARGAAAAGAAAHDGEHSIEVQVPFIQRMSPGSMLCPVAVPPDARAAEVGRAAARAAKSLGRRIAVLGSTDLTHYGRRFGFAPRGAGEAAHEWAKTVNDMKFLDAVLSLDPLAALAEASEGQSACGAGAAAAAVACAAGLGAGRAALLRHTTSFEVAGGSARDFVGYAAVAFLEV